MVQVTAIKIMNPPLHTNGHAVYLEMTLPNNKKTYILLGQFENLLGAKTFAERQQQKMDGLVPVQEGD